MITLDPKISQLLPLSFVKAELALYPSIKSVQLNEYLWTLKRCWAGYLPHDQSIRFDPTVQPSVICKAINGRWPELCLQEGEAWMFAFYHEIDHAMGEQSEWECDRYAMRRIFELRKKKEGERKKFVDLIREVVAKGIRASLSREER